MSENNPGRSDSSDRQILQSIAKFVDDSNNAGKTDVLMLTRIIASPVSGVTHDASSPAPDKVHPAMSSEKETEDTRADLPSTLSDDVLTSIADEKVQQEIAKSVPEEVKEFKPVYFSGLSEQSDSDGFEDGAVPQNMSGNSDDFEMAKLNHRSHHYENYNEEAIEKKEAGWFKRLFSGKNKKAKAVDASLEASEHSSNQNLLNQQPSVLPSPPQEKQAYRTAEDTSAADTSTADTSTAGTSTADTSAADTSTAGTSTADTSAAEQIVPPILPDEEQQTELDHPHDQEMKELDDVISSLDILASVRRISEDHAAHPAMTERGDLDEGETIHEAMEEVRGMVEEKIEKNLEKYAKEHDFDVVPDHLREDVDHWLDDHISDFVHKKMQQDKN